ncbi:hypothetical protein [Bradyrhizobium sp. AUGA SZCCT0042]|uniref:hypothetical protein n=1 Tax=Bradyrhizobium sp. AUGA SZCCT0042 TaxID=2807651 RepID=UPI001BAD2C8F|nr:hypothetical protein [Bradyrhizobium sp. AUGA SZCCT0042]MBR1298551.1 hypothetical protein [Bradyrhizobium sp. AUGA SZCCT0042]
MAFQSREADAYAEIDKAQRAVKSAMQKHSAGGSVDAVNKANKRLADAHNAAWRTSAGLATDD